MKLHRKGWGGMIAALALMLTFAADAAPKREGVTPALVEGAIAILAFNHDPAQWTKAGKPRVAAIEKLINADISAKDRDAAWKAYKNPAPAVAPVSVDASKVAALEAEVAQLKTTLDIGVDTVAALERKIGRHEETIAHERSRAERAENHVATARRNAQRVMDEHAALNAAAREQLRQASADRVLAGRVLEEAKAREAGAGPAASRDCRRALRQVVDAGWTWGGQSEGGGVPRDRRAHRLRPRMIHYTDGGVAPRTNAYTGGGTRMSYKSKAQARAVLANTSGGNPRHREARAHAKSRLRKPGGKKRRGLMPTRAKEMM